MYFDILLTFKFDIIFAVVVVVVGGRIIRMTILLKSIIGRWRGDGGRLMKMIIIIITTEIKIAITQVMRRMMMMMIQTGYQHSGS